MFFIIDTFCLFSNLNDGHSFDPNPNLFLNPDCLFCPTWCGMNSWWHLINCIQLECWFIVLHYISLWLHIFYWILFYISHLFIKFACWPPSCGFLTGRRSREWTELDWRRSAVRRVQSGRQRARWQTSKEQAPPPVPPLALRTTKLSKEPYSWQVGPSCTYQFTCVEGGRTFTQLASIDVLT